MTLYETLGVPKTASADRIRRAYRKRAAATHPDRNPGDADAEAKHRAVTDAYAVLSDPDRRKLYDETGATAKPRDTDLERLMGLVQPALIAVMQQAATGPMATGLAHTDVVAKTRETLAARLADAKQHLRKVRASLSALEESVSRFGVVGDGENLLAACVRAQAEQGRAAATAIERDVADLAAAVDYLRTCTYRTDDPLFHPGAWRTTVVPLGFVEPPGWCGPDPKPLTGGTT